jgi:hypothetical protein
MRACMTWRMMRSTNARRRASGLSRSIRSKKLLVPTACPAAVAAAASCAYAAAVVVPSLRNTSHCRASGHVSAMHAGTWEVKWPEDDRDKKRLLILGLAQSSLHVHCVTEQAVEHTNLIAFLPASSTARARLACMLLHGLLRLSTCRQHKAARLLASRRAAPGNKAAQQLAHVRALLAHAGRLHAHCHSLRATIALRCIGAGRDVLVNYLTVCRAPWLVSTQVHKTIAPQHTARMNTLPCCQTVTLV